MSRQESGVGRREPGVVRARAWRGAWLFVALAILVTPLFAHGCHGDDVDHEPLVIPRRTNPEER